jgi:DNA mismatch repair ATPase MutL
MFKNFNNKVIITIALLATTIITCCCILLIPKFARNTTAKENKETITFIEKETSTLITKNDASTESSTSEIVSEEESESQTEEIETQIETEETQTEYINNEQNYNDENNSAEKTNYTSPEIQEPEPQPEPTPIPNPEPEPQPDPEPEVVEDHIVYKPDGSIDLNESYWVKGTASTAISKSNEFQALMAKYYNIYGENASFHITKVGTSQNNIINVYSYSYRCKILNTGDTIRFIFNGSEFVEE